MKTARYCFTVWLDTDVDEEDDPTLYVSRKEQASLERLMISVLKSSRQFNGSFDAECTDADLVEKETK